MAKGQTVEEVAEAKKIRSNGNGRPVPTWPPCEPVMPFFQIKSFPKRLHRRLRILAAMIERGTSETACRVIEAGLEVVENLERAKDERGED